MKKSILATAFVIVSSILSLPAKAASFSEVYVFGDSLSDTGNFFQVTGIPPKPYFDGRASNGPLWVEYLAIELELSPNPNTNFAFFGATTGELNTEVASLPALQQQVNNFTQNTPVADSNALYTIWAGANDYLNENITDTTIPVNNLITAVNSLAEIGAKDIMVVNLPDLGDLPGINSDPVIASFLNNISESHNSLLNQSLNQLENSKVNLTLLDVNSLVKNVINNPENFGFTNGTDACLNIEAQTICNNPNEYVFWDGIHPGTNAHQIIGEFAAQELENQTTTVPEPNVTFAILTFGVLGIVTKQKKG